MSDQETVDFSCQKCGKECDVAPKLPDRPICPDCCEDHEYEYDPSFQQHRCKHCDKSVPEDWYDDID